MQLDGLIYQANLLKVQQYLFIKHMHIRSVSIITDEAKGEQVNIVWRFLQTLQRQTRLSKKMIPYGDDTARYVNRELADHDSIE